MEAVMENIVIEAIVKKDVRWKELLSVACPSSLSTHTT